MKNVMKDTLKYLLGSESVEEEKPMTVADFENHVLRELRTFVNGADREGIRGALLTGSGPLYNKLQELLKGKQCLYFTDAAINKRKQEKKTENPHKVSVILHAMMYLLPGYALKYNLVPVTKNDFKGLVKLCNFPTNHEVFPMVVMALHPFLLRPTDDSPLKTEALELAVHMLDSIIEAKEEKDAALPGQILVAEKGKKSPPPKTGNNAKEEKDAALPGQIAVAEKGKKSPPPKTGNNDTTDGGELTPVSKMRERFHGMIHDMGMEAQKTIGNTVVIAKNQSEISNKLASTVQDQSKQNTMLLEEKKKDQQTIADLEAKLAAAKSEAATAAVPTVENTMLLEEKEKDQQIADLEAKLAAAKADAAAKAVPVTPAHKPRANAQRSTARKKKDDSDSFLQERPVPKTPVWHNNRKYLVKSVSEKSGRATLTDASGNTIRGTPLWSNLKKYDENEHE